MKTMKSAQPDKQGIARARVRPMIRRDASEVLRIEWESFDWPWEKADFLRVLGLRNCTGMVAEIDDRVAGYMVYVSRTRSIDLLNFAVAADCRRREVGSQLAAWLKAALTSQRQWQIFTHVRESNLAAQLFFKSLGFRCRAIVPCYYDNDEDAYRFAWRPRAGESIR